jgi:putative transposase
VEESLRSNRNTKEEQWSKSVAVGSEAFIMNTMEKLDINAKGREAVETDGRYQLREPVLFL